MHQIHADVTSVGPGAKLLLACVLDAIDMRGVQQQLCGNQPIDTDPRGLFVDRVISIDTTRDHFINGAVKSLHSWADQQMDVECLVASDRVALAFKCNDLSKLIHITAHAVTCEWTWNPTAFPADAWFRPELSASTELAVPAPGAERWDYPSQTASHSAAARERAKQRYHRSGRSAARAIG